MEEQVTNEENLHKVGEVDSCIDRSAFIAELGLEDKSCVNGIGFIASDYLTVSGTYEYGAMAGEALVVDGTIKKDAFLAGSQVNIKSEAYLGRDLYVAGSSVILKTDVKGDLHAAGETIKISNSIISGDAEIYAGRIEFGENVEVLGTLSYSEDAIVSGEAKSNNLEIITSEEQESSSASSTLISDTITVVALVVTTLVFVLVGKKFISRMHEKTEKYTFINALADFGIGLLAVVVVPVAALFVMFTLIGLPVAIIALCFYAVMLLLSTSALATLLAKKWFKKIKNQTLAPLLMVLILGILSVLPYIGWIFIFIELCTGSGIILRTLFKKNPEEKKKKAVKKI